MKTVIVCLCWLLSAGDAVYMDNEQSLEEYVLSQDGIIFRGSVGRPISTPWNFGQVPTPTLMLSASPLNTRTVDHASRHCEGVCGTSILINGVFHNCKRKGIWEHLSMKLTEVFFI